MESIYEAFSYDFFQNAFWAAILASLTCGIIGTYVVARRLVFISGGITHASFGGLGIAYFLGINPIVGAAVFSILSALGIEVLSKKTEIREDSVIAMLWSFGMAIGIIFIYITPGYAPNLANYLFGSILTVSNIDLKLLLLLTLISSVFFFLFYKPILFISFDEEYAITRKIPVRFFNMVLLSLISLTIVFNIRVTGVILVLSLLTIPQNIANLFTNNYGKLIFASIFISLIGTISGLIASYIWNIPSGALIVFLLVLMFVIAKILKAIISQKKISSI